MKIKIFFLLVLMPLLVLRCKKEETHKLVTIGGYAVDIESGDTLSDVKIRLRRQDIIARGTGNSLRDYKTLLDSTITDENGYFSFTHNMFNDKNYAFEPIKKKYYWRPSMELTPVNTESGLNVLTPLIPLTYLKINIINEFPNSIYDSIYYNGPIEWPSLPVTDLYNVPLYSHTFGLNGTEIDTTFFVTLLYYDLPLQYWDVTKNGTTIRNAAYIGCNPLDTCFFQIKY